MRTDNRDIDQLRPLSLVPDVLNYAEGSVEVTLGSTRVLCSASLEDRVPKWLQGSGKGWVSAEYGMLPRSTHQRINRDRAANSGRTQEISRLIGRSLRAAVDLESLGERQIYVDCDVIQADGGTRTAAINGGFVALAFALKFLADQGELKKLPLIHYVGAVSVGLKDNQALLDLNYDEDSTVETDMNFVMTNDDRFIEIQGTAEEKAFSQDQLNQMISLARLGCQQIYQEQQKLVGEFFPLKNED